MKSMRWKLVHGSSSDMSYTTLPCPRRENSLTLISQSTAVLYGGSVRAPHTKSNGNCWLLDLDKAMQLHDPSSIWTKVSRPNLRPRFLHSAVMDVGNRLWLIGGLGYKSDNQYIEVNMPPEKITLTPAPLKVLAVEYVAEITREGDPRIQPDKFPKSLCEDIGNTQRSK